MKKIFTFLMALVLSLSVGTATFAAESSVSFNNSKDVLIVGQFDCPLKDVIKKDGMSLSSFATAAVANVRVRSYATYDEEDGVSVNVELYVPWYEFTNPEFTCMYGTVEVDLNNETTTDYFYETEDGASTISTDVDTGVVGDSGDTGTVSVAGFAEALKALGGGGAFAISYDISIP